LERRTLRSIISRTPLPHQFEQPPALNLTKPLDENGCVELCIVDVEGTDPSAPATRARRCRD
ncbi:hypothetical protein, partial [Burkholderia gladioli]